jgi:UDP-N-acetylmuramate: L-alanyl-gamma-D-glutamyl-meso-diaminopimelate ligase
VGDEPVLALIEPRSNTMKQGVHRDTLLPSAAAADRVFWANLNDSSWLSELVERWQQANVDSGLHRVEASVDDVIAQVMADVTSPCHIVIMSNGAFGGIHQRLIAKIERING